MTRQIPGTIYPAEHRHVVTQETFTASSFSSDCTPGAYKIGVVDVELGPSASYRFDTEAWCSILVLPVNGGVKLRREAKDSRNDTYVYAGRAARADFMERDHVALVNPLRDYWSSAIVIGIGQKSGMPVLGSPIGISHGFDLASHTNELLAVHFGQDEARGKHPFDAYIGSFQYRGEYRLPIHRGRHVFVLAIQGAVEVEGRLLCSKDALMLWDTPSVALESLADESLVLVMHVL